MLADEVPAYVAPPRRRRIWPYVLLVVLVLIGGVLLIADRVTASIAEGKVADRLSGQTPFTGRPSVSIHGVPFLTQAVGGVYDDIEVKGAGEPVGMLGPVQIDARLHGVHLSLSAATSHVDQVPVDRIKLAISVSLGQVAAASGVDGLTLQSNGDQVTARGNVDVPVLGKVPVTATGRLVIASDGSISVDLTSLSGVGVTLPASAQAVARSALKFVVPTGGLPFSSVATSIQTSGDTVRIVADARNVVLQ